MLNEHGHCFDVDGYTVKCRSVFSYEYDQVKTAVLFMKENPEKCIYNFFAAYLAREIRNIGYTGKAVITYVPRSDEGMRDNGFDQSKLLAKMVSRIVPDTECLTLIKRTGKSKAQKSLKGKDREENVKGKFCAVKTAASPKNIIITDDMFTTGSSMKECVSVLKNAYPDADIFCVTAAKTPNTNSAVKYRKD